MLSLFNLSDSDIRYGQGSGLPLPDMVKVSAICDKCGLVIGDKIVTNEVAQSMVGLEQHAVCLCHNCKQLLLNVIRREENNDYGW